MKRFLFAVIFLLSLASFIISLGEFWNIGIFVDEHNFSPDIVLGGHGWLLAVWARLGLLLLSCIVSFWGMIAKSKKKENKQNGGK